MQPRENRLLRERAAREADGQGQEREPHAERDGDNAGSETASEHMSSREDGGAEEISEAQMHEAGPR